jgi:hypothetical protein
MQIIRKGEELQRGPFCVDVGPKFIANLSARDAQLSGLKQRTEDGSFSD